MSKRQRVVNYPTEVDTELAAFVADVLELAGQFRHAADEIARTEGETQSRWYALSVFSAGPLTVAQAARRLGTSRQAVQRTANELVDRSLAVTEPNPDHRTSPFVVLTDEGREVLARISREAMTARRRWFADGDTPDLQRAHAEVVRLRDALRADAKRDP